MNISADLISNHLPANFHLDLWQDGPLNRWAFQHVSNFLTTQDICADDTCVRTSEPTVNLIGDIDVSIDGRTLKMTEILNETYTDSILVLRKGSVVYEKYFNGMTSGSKHLLQSVSKSILGLLYSRMIDAGVIDPEQRMGHYLPVLNSCVFGSATIAQALDMRAALKFSEDYVSPHSEMTQLDRACGWKPNPMGEYPNLSSFLLSLKPRISNVTGLHLEHGAEFQYCSATTDALAWLISHVTGEPYSKLLERELWRPMGAWEDANIAVDSEASVYTTEVDTGKRAQKFIRIKQ